jgi:two-component system cell cycle sensor histidine kinase/response regulator CckA
MDAEPETFQIPRGFETILVAEDNEALRTLLRIALERCGYTILEARNGPEALRLAELHHEPISLLVSDLEMPRMGGLQLARQLALARPGLKLLLLSGRDCASDLVDSGVAFLRKPFRPSALAAKVRLVLHPAPAGRDSRPTPSPLPFTAAR